MSVIQELELKSGKTKWLYRILIVILILGALLQVFPMFWMFMGTFKTNEELVSAIPSLLPENWGISAYLEALSTYDIWNNIGNTAFLCIAVIVIQISNSILSAYSLSKLRPKCGKFILMLFMGTMMFSGTALLFPLYIMMSQMGLIGSKWALVLSSSAWAYSILLFNSFFDNIPRDLLEAASIDGAGKVTSLTKIILPLSKPIIAVNVVNTFMAVYNDFLYPLMLLPDEKDWTIMIRVYMLDKLGTVSPNVMYVMLVITVVPVLIVYLIAQKNIAEGISTTGIKG